MQSGLNVFSGFLSFEEVASWGGGGGVKLGGGGVMVQFGVMNCPKCHPCKFFPVSILSPPPLVRDSLPWSHFWYPQTADIKNGIRESWTTSPHSQPLPTPPLGPSMSVYVIYWTHGALRPPAARKLKSTCNGECLFTLFTLNVDFKED